MRRWLEITLEIPEKLEEEVTIFLMELGSCGVLKDGRRLMAYFAEDNLLVDRMLAINRYMETVQGAEFRYRFLHEQDWNEKWKEGFKVQKVSDRILIVPPWEYSCEEDSSVIIKIEPGMAFGTGEHITTKMCLEIMDRLYRISVPESFLDVGTGSGILSIAAVKLGSKKVFALDIDLEAVAEARKNIELNSLSGKIAVEQISLSQVKGKYMMIAANILSSVLCQLRDLLISRLEKEGFLILSGILEEEMEKVGETFQPLQTFLSLRREGWGCFALRRV